MSGAPKLPTNTRPSKANAPLIGRPVKIFVFLFFGLFATLLIVGAITSKGAKSNSTDPIVETTQTRYQEILKDIESKGVVITKDVSESGSSMVFLDRNWQTIDFNKKTFYLSDSKTANYIDFALWFHMQLNASLEDREAAAREFNQLLSSLINDPSILKEGEAFLISTLKNIAPDVSPEFSKNGYSITLNAFQDQPSKFMIQVNVHVPKQ